MDSTERRRQRRRKERLALVFHYAQEKCEVHTVDVSVSGALLSTPVSFPSGTLLILECPGLCTAGHSVRMLAKVVRASQRPSDLKKHYSGLGLLWIRAYASDGKDVLVDFLVDKLGIDREAPLDIGISPAGDAVYNFPAVAPEEKREGVSPDEARRLTIYQDQREKLVAMQRGRFRVETPIIYSVHNMHYRGKLMALGNDGLAVATNGALPFQFAKVVIRYPVEDSPRSPRVVFFCETEIVVQPFSKEPGMFTARTLGLDELNSPGLLRMHMRTLAQRFPRW